MQEMSCERPTNDFKTLSLVPTKLGTLADVGLASLSFNTQLALEDIEHDETVYGGNDIFDLLLQNDMLQNDTQPMQNANQSTPIVNQSMQTMPQETQASYIEVTRVPTPPPQYDSCHNNENQSPPLDSPRSFRPIGYTHSNHSRRVTPLRELIPSRVHSRASSRPVSRSSVVDVLGQFVNRYADDQIERDRATAQREQNLLNTNAQREQKLLDMQLEQERRAADERNRLMREREILLDREQRQFELNAQKEKEHAQLALKREQEQAQLALKREQEQAQLALEREKEQARLALERENRIRDDMRQLAQLEARNAALEEQLKAKVLETKIAQDTPVAQKQPTVSDIQPTSPKPAVLSSSPEIDYFGHFLPPPPTFDPNTVPVISAASIMDMSPQQLSQVMTTGQTVSQSTVTIPKFASPQTPALSSTTLVPLSSISNWNPEIMKSLTVIKTPSGPAVQTCQLGMAQPLEKKCDTKTMTTAVYTATTSMPAVTEISKEISSSPVSPIALPTSSEHPTSSITATPTVAPATMQYPSPQSSVPIVVVTTQQTVRPYNGSTSWTSFRDHFTRVAKVNNWNTDDVKAQHLSLALEGAAAETLKDIHEGSPTLLNDIWDALARRFGEVDEIRAAMTKFEHRRQHEGESVAELNKPLELFIE